MTMIRKLVRAQINQLGDDEVEVVISTSSLARDGHILIPAGCVTENYQRNPIWLWSHNADVPTGNAETITIEPDCIRVRYRFAPRGISPRADEINGLVKSGVIRAASIGFEPIEMEPLDPKKPRGGQRITKWDWLESSWVSVPSDTDALVTARSHGDDDMIEIDAAPAEPVVEPPQRAAGIMFKRGLYQVAQLCYLFEELGWHVDMSKYEAASEGDASKVPAMLAGVLGDLGDALLAMTQEEVAEALAGHDVEPEEDADDIVLVVEEREHIAAAATPQIRAFRRGLAHAKLRAGKKLSTETVRCLREARDIHDEAMTLHRGAMKKHKDGAAAIDGLLERSGVSDPDNEDAQTIQTSAETGVDEGSEGQRVSASFRRRQADLLALAVS